MARESTRHAAVEAADGSDGRLELEPDAEGLGLREWFDELHDSSGDAAAFDTRIHRSPILTGQASKGIGRRLRRLGRTLLVEPRSFFVSDDDLEPGEAERAREWGALLAATLSDAGAATPS
jgi:hypothetical protein